MNIFLSSLNLQNIFLKDPLFVNKNYYLINSQFTNFFSTIFYFSQIKNIFLNSLKFSNLLSSTLIYNNKFLISNPIISNNTVTFFDCLFFNSTNSIDFIYFNSSLSNLTFKNCGFFKIYSNFMTINVINSNSFLLIKSCFHMTDAKHVSCFRTSYFNNNIKENLIEFLTIFNCGEKLSSNFGPHTGAYQKLLLNQVNITQNFAIMGRSAIGFSETPINQNVAHYFNIQNCTGPYLIQFHTNLENTFISYINFINNNISNNLFFSEMNNYITVYIFNSTFLGNSHIQFVNFYNGQIILNNCFFDFSSINGISLMSNKISLINPNFDSLNYFISLKNFQSFNCWTNIISSSVTVNKWRLFFLVVINLEISI